MPVRVTDSHIFPLNYLTVLVLKGSNYMLFQSVFISLLARLIIDGTEQKYFKHSQHKQDNFII